MYLVIAEKPSVSRAIAEVIGAQEREDGYLQGTDCMVSWCFGHLAEYVSPDAYDEDRSDDQRDRCRRGGNQHPQMPVIHFSLRLFRQSILFLPHSYHLYHCSIFISQFT